jgi:hypothetical protein
MAVEKKPWSRVLLLAGTPLAAVGLLLAAGVNPLRAGVLITMIGATGFILSTLETMGKIDNEDMVFGLLFGLGATLLADWYISTHVLVTQTLWGIALSSAVAGGVGAAVATTVSLLVNRAFKKWSKAPLSLRLAGASPWLE